MRYQDLPGGLEVGFHEVRVVARAARRPLEDVARCPRRRRDLLRPPLRLDLLEVGNGRPLTPCCARAVRCKTKEKASGGESSAHHAADNIKKRQACVRLLLALSLSLFLYAVFCGSSLNARLTAGTA